MRTNQLIKYTLFVSCYLFWVASGLMVAVGIYAKLSKEASAVDSLLADPSLMLLTVGILMFAITFVGCTGALRDLPMLLKIALTPTPSTGVLAAGGRLDGTPVTDFAWTLLIVLILQIVAAVLGFLFSGMVMEKAAFLMGKAISSYRDDLDLQNLIDYIQKKFECCGVHSYKDWSQNIYFECRDSNPSLERCAVPFSCCTQEDKGTVLTSVLNTMCGYGTQNLRPWEAESLIYTEGCLEKIVNWGQRNLLLVAGLAIGLFVLEVLVFSLAIMLIYQINFIIQKRQSMRRCPEKFLSRTDSNKEESRSEDTTMSLSCLSPDTRRDLLQGKTVPLPFQPSSLVRIFISSDSSDTSRESEALLEAACPELQAFCQKHGLMFEMIDFRWGVCDLAGPDHTDTELCLEEIESCQKLSVGTSFITLREAVPEAEAYFEMGPLSGKEGREMLEGLLASAGRKLSPAQRAVLQHSLPAGGDPLLFQLAFQQVRSWASYTPPSALVISRTVQDALHQLCDTVEKLHGSVLVSRALGYIASSRNGLAEAELKDILSLDDEVLSEIYQHSSPPSKTILRFPPLLWARLRRDVQDCLVERQADGFTLLGLAPRQFAEVVQNRYLSAQNQTKRHLLLADFFRGTWSWGMKKPFLLPLCGTTLNADRKVAPQPLWFSDTVANQRKLSEFPFHLLCAGRIEELKRDVLGNMNWIICKITAAGIESVVDDFAMCITHTNCPELSLVRDALLLLKPTIDDMDGVVGMSTIYTEVLARLHFFMSSYPDLIGRLCQQCLHWFEVCPHPVLIPLCGFLQPPGGPLQKTLTGFLKGVTVLELSSEHKLMVAGSQDGSMLVWNMENIEVMQALTGHTAEVKCVKVFGKGTSAVSAAMDHTLRIWNLVSGTEKFSIEDTHFSKPHLCQLHVDERNMVVYSASGEKVSGWHLETAELVFQISGDVQDVWLCTAVFVPRLAILTVSEGGIVCLWDRSTGAMQSKHQLSWLQKEAPTCSALIQKQGKMVAGFSKGSLSVISSDGTSLLEKLPQGVRFVVTSEDESLLAAGFGEYVRVFLADSNGFCRFLATDLEHEGVVHTAVISSDNNIIVTGSQAAYIQVWSLSEQGLLKDTLDCSAVSQDGNYVYFPQPGENHKVVIWNSIEGAECDTLDTSAQWALSGSEDSLLCLWDLELCQWKHEICYYKHSSFLKGIECACFSKDDKYLYTGLLDQSIAVWDVSNGALLAVQCVHATARRIVPTADGFVATTNLGYIIREKFHCPQSSSHQHDPLQHVEATCTVKSRKGEEANSGVQHHNQGNTSRHQSQNRKPSQICAIVIDTPGVIRRVSQLFHEHPDLIVGFNAFLPLGYRIEIPKNGKLSIQSPLASQVSSEPVPSALPGSGLLLHYSQENSHNHSDCSEEYRQQLPYKEDKSQIPLESDSVEFNNAISYVNKIKTRFLDHPEIYRSFLEILHTYQKEQLNTKGRPFRGMSEEEVFTEVANLFRGQEDLLSEFGQFLPEAKRSLFTGNGPCEMNSAQKIEHEKNLEHSKKRSRPLMLRPVSGPAKKKMKLRGTKDLSVATVGKYGTLQEFSFFDKVRRVLKSQEVYENFLRCIALFNQELVSGSELLQLVTPFLGKFPELFAQFKSFLGVKELSFASPLSDRSGDGMSREIDYASCKRIGSSYRALPKTYQQPKCSGRTAICKEVLNDTWVSFPSWSEDSTFVSSKKTPYEEQLHRCEDERFELDVVLETNLATIRVLESVQKKLSRMSQEDQEKFRLDDCLGGTSEVIQRRAIYRIYGDKAPEIIESLKKNPVTAVPVVLKRLKAKEEEWREAQQGFNKIWREQYEKAYLKSLDHQAVNFKQNDTKALRSKSLLNEIESVYDEHQEQHSEGRSSSTNEPHLIFIYEDKQILEDAASLISYYVKRQPTIQKEDQATIRQIVHHFIPELFFSPPPEHSISEESTDEDREHHQAQVLDTAELRKKLAPVLPSSPLDTKAMFCDVTAAEPHNTLDDVYSLFFVNNNWYFFLRLHQTLCSRLLKIYRQAQKQLLEYRSEKEREKLLCDGRKEKTNDPAMELRLKQPSEVELEEYYPAFLDMVRSLLDGNIDPTQYEDTLREMFTIHAYIGFTMDKLVQNIVRQLHHLVSDDICLKVVELYLNERKRGAAGGNLSSRCVRAAKETSYQWKAERCMADENCFKVMFLQRKGQVIMTIELLDTEETQTEDPVEVQHLANYMEQYVGVEGAPSSQNDGFLLKPVFLQRNLKKFRKWQCKQVRALRSEAKSSWKRLIGVESACNVDCRFKLNSHKMMFIVNSEDYMYRRGALCRAKQAQPVVLLKHHQQFDEWHSRWLEENVTVEAADLVQDWLMGDEDEDMVPCKTTCETISVHGVPVNRYRVQYSRRPASP
ncbi:NACHT domain- and WD repeat-containing protein 1 isoform D [Alligator mississippiensis]|uniref:Tetraspanin-33 n=1 Tax=Alligator mississippiensis TaxID=8496 RepID=A0A151NYP1_ALLMI|nr:NACHT domain- and WD repeat-containing protein 1 isoform D [Alligator mississippiensis]